MSGDGDDLGSVFRMVSKLAVSFNCSHVLFISSSCNLMHIVILESSGNNFD